ncbi:hypothetical protein BAUCODRAFT_435817 [Baudoinia panamericana UAMH 10762]|uniref:Uncharacterized protein n=1 Tax=Baudoinia panamericana (strain UAMH 10762) TaxID=717646 RepID=M2NDQ7_BAUPA|nr:uncharacterized protein BAUCODRAFT_435817 [Baudoinia panamericana UAMH 10762]EMC97025.1 hypothetical protein BAUCODRAFT_435817 [Baudoinia panamericana UAMH 10762]
MKVPTQQNGGSRPDATGHSPPYTSTTYLPPVFPTQPLQQPRPKRKRPALDCNDDDAGFHSTLTETAKRSELALSSRRSDAVHQRWGNATHHNFLPSENESVGAQHTSLHFQAVTETIPIAIDPARRLLDKRYEIVRKLQALKTQLSNLDATHLLDSNLEPTPSLKRRRHDGTVNKNNLKTVSTASPPVRQILSHNTTNEEPQQTADDSGMVGGADNTVDASPTRPSKSAGNTTVPPSSLFLQKPDDGMQDAASSPPTRAPTARTTNDAASEATCTITYDVSTASLTYNVPAEAISNQEIINAHTDDCSCSDAGL